MTVKNGRLINNRPVGKSGIEEAGELRKMVKKNEKTNMIADGIERAEMKKDMNKLFKGI
ncbi:MAG: hypothetical protein GY855_07490 [candidate division Zixibacteria bacterium]|nr:hypothetical protein [candidate division Zixibacteria bacterium]